MSTLETKANADLAAGEERRRFWSGATRKVLVVLGVLICLIAAGLGGLAYATYDYADRYEGRILPGSTVAGVDIGGLTRPDALNRVRAVVRPQLTRQIEVRWRDRTWTVTPKELGARSDARAAVADAVTESEAASFLDLARMRWLGEDLDFERSVGITYPRRGARRFIDKVAARLDEEPSDAYLDYSTGWVNIVPERSGRKVLVEKARHRLMNALKNGSSKMVVPVNVLEPDVTAAAYDQVLLLRIGENKLYLYDNGQIARSWTVATGQPEYPTPTGVYEVTLKRYMPTWVNPDPKGWGADMPKMIPPGPGNPLGVRALNWSAPAIRFHGTEATYSLGYNASHGCVRLSNSEVVDLYNLVDVGTPIVSIRAGELKPLYASGPDPTVVPEEDGGEKKETG